MAQKVPHVPDVLAFFFEAECEGRESGRCVWVSLSLCVCVHMHMREGGVGAGRIGNGRKSVGVVMLLPGLVSLRKHTKHPYPVGRALW